MIDTCQFSGFELVTNPTKVKDFHDDDEIRRVYYPEMEAAVKNAMKGAAKVIVFDHTVRSSQVKQLNTLGAAASTAG